MSELAVVVEAKGLDTTLIILIQLHLVLHNFYACFEDTLVLHGLADLDLASSGALTLRRVRALTFHGITLARWLIVFGRIVDFLFRTSQTHRAHALFGRGRIFFNFSSTRLSSVVIYSRLLRCEVRYASSLCS